MAHHVHMSLPGHMVPSSRPPGPPRGFTLGPQPINQPQPLSVPQPLPHPQPLSQPQPLPHPHPLCHPQPLPTQTFPHPNNLPIQRSSLSTPGTPGGTGPQRMISGVPTTPTQASRIFTPPGPAPSTVAQGAKPTAFQPTRQAAALPERTGVTRATTGGDFRSITSDAPKLSSRSFGEGDVELDLQSELQRGIEVRRDLSYRGQSESQHIDLDTSISTPHWVKEQKESVHRLRQEMQQMISYVQETMQRECAASAEFKKACLTTQHLLQTQLMELRHQLHTAVDDIRAHIQKSDVFESDVRGDMSSFSEEISLKFSEFHALNEREFQDNAKLVEDLQNLRNSVTQLRYEEDGLRREFKSKENATNKNLTALDNSVAELQQKFGNCSSSLADMQLAYNHLVSVTEAEVAAVKDEVDSHRKHVETVVQRVDFQLSRLDDNQKRTTNMETRLKAQVKGLQESLHDTSREMSAIKDHVSDSRVATPTLSGSQSSPVAAPLTSALSPGGLVRGSVESYYPAANWNPSRSGTLPLTGPVPLSDGGGNRHAQDPAFGSVLGRTPRVSYQPNPMHAQSLAAGQLRPLPPPASQARSSLPAPPPVDVSRSSLANPVTSPPALVAQMSAPALSYPPVLPPRFVPRPSQQVVQPSPVFLRSPVNGPGPFIGGTPAPRPMFRSSAVPQSL